MKIVELLQIAFRAGQNVETSGPILDDDAEFDEWIEDNQHLVKNCLIADVVGSLPSDEEINVEAYQRDYFNASEESAFKDGCKFVVNKVSGQ